MASNMTTKQLTEELDGFRAICREYFNGSEGTQTAQCLHEAVDSWTDEIFTLNEYNDEQDEKIEDLEKQVFDLKEENEKLTEEREKKVLDLDVFYKAEWNACEELKELKEQIKDQDDYDIDVSVNYWKSSWEIIKAENDRLKKEIAEFKKTD